MVTRINNDEVYMLTTVDNPFNPFEEFDKWLVFDTAHGYNTCGYLDRIAVVSEGLSDADLDVAIKLAMDEIIKENTFGVHKLVSRSSFSKVE